MQQFLLLFLLCIKGVHSNWDVQCPNDVKSVPGSCILIPCSFNYPSNIQPTKGITMIWYKDVKVKNTLVYHSTKAIAADFEGRVEMLGDANQKTCTLLIRNIRKADAGVYLFRFEINAGNSWSAKKGVNVEITDNPIIPEVVLPSRIVEDESVTFKCSTPYFCPNSSIALKWHGYNTTGSNIMSNVQKDTSGVLVSETLTTSFTWQENQKLIRCEVMVGAQKAVKEVRPFITHSPKDVKVLIKPSEGNIKQGTSVTLTCQVASSNPAPGYTWYKDGKQFSKEQSVSFQSISRNDHGEYTCEARNTLGSATSEIARLVVFSAVTLVSPSSEVQEGAAVTMTCEVLGVNPDEISYSWFKNTLLMNERSGQSIIFQKVTRSDAGNYNCRIENDKGSDSSPAVVLNVLYSPDDVKVLIKPSEGNIKRGTSVTLTCQVNSSNPAPRYTWSKDGKQLSTGQSVYYHRVSRNDHGEYRCQAQNQIGSITSEPTRLVVFSPETLVSPSSTVREGEVVTISCDIPENIHAEISYSWFKNSILMNEQSGKSLLFQEIASTDSGNYNCQIENDKGSESSEAIVLTVLHSPKGVKVLIKPPEENIKEGIFVTLTCQVNSSNPAVSNYSWYKDGKQLSRDQYISFHSISRTDLGEYRCEAQNTIGTTTSVPAPLVIFSADILVSPSSEVKEGESVTLTCKVPGAKPEEIHYSWFKNSILMDKSSGESIIFQEVSSNDSGNYNCRIENDKSSDSSKVVVLNVLYPPRIPKLFSYMKTHEGKLAFIECTVESNPTSELQLYRNDQLIANTSSHSAPTQRLSVTSTQNALRLKMQEVKLADEGTYRCFARNTIGNSTASLHFSVQKARVVISPSSEIKEGIVVTLTCLETQNTEKGTKYNWYKNGKKLTKALEENTLLFRRVSSSDSGSYYCTVQNHKGSSTSSLSTLQVLFSPRQISVISMVTMQGGILGIIQCSVDSDPPSDVSIYREDMLIASTSVILPDMKYNVVSSTNSLKLEIQDVVIEDEGLYTCLANNTYGHVTGSLDFTAETAKLIIAPLSGVREGDPVTMTCILSSASEKGMYLYTWYKNNVLHSEGPGPSLSFHQVSSDDSGSYYCKAANNESSKSSAPIRLNVEYSPRHTQFESFLDTEEGNFAFICCTIDSYPVAELSLYRQKLLVASTQNQNVPNERYTVYVAQNSIKLEIRNVMLDDEGEYICNSKNTVGEASESIYFKVQTERISVNPSSKVLEEEKVILTCDSSISRQKATHITYSWYKNSQWLQDSTDRSLVFEKILSSDAGYYYCRAHNTQNSSLSPSVLLQVSYSPREPTMSVFWEAQRDQVGVIQCSVGSDPPSWIGLYRKDTLVASSDSSKMLNERMNISTSNNTLKLEIMGVLLEDEGDYLCTANNSIGSSRSTINFKADITTIQVTPSSRVLERDTVNLACVMAIDSPEEATYSWYKNGDKYGDGTSRTLVFENVSSEAGGSYYCTVETDHGSKSSLPITVNILYAPRNARIISFLEMLNGKGAVILCTVESNPPSEMSLFKQDKLIASSVSSRGANNRIQSYFSLDTLRVQITNLMLSDEGTYTFIAKNIHGTTNASVDFTVEGVRVLISPSSPLQEGDSVTLTCDVLANLHLVTGYTWYKNSEWFQEGSVRTVVFGRVSSSDSGSYFCTAHSIEGIRTSLPVTIHVLYTPRGMSLTSIFQTQERYVRMMCSVDSDPPSQLSLHRGDDVMVSFDSLDSNQHLKLSHNSLRLEIYNVTKDDQGEYTCHANNSLGAAEISVFFSVEWARVLVFPSAKVGEGTYLNLTCETYSTTQENASYTWYKNNKLLKEGSNVSLILPNVTITDAGSYHCLIKHGNRSIISPIVGIDVLYAPRNLLMTSFLETHGRQHGIILCSVDSVPVSMISLYRNDVLQTSTTQSLLDQGKKFWTSNNYLRLEIRGITAEDVGTYVCTAKNSLGTATSSIIFTIHDGAVLAYKVLAWTTVTIFIWLLVASILVFVYCKRIKGMYMVRTDEGSVNSYTEEETQNDMLS
ncbi:sialoadhesin-like [Discoglossus pictus]